MNNGKAFSQLVLDALSSHVAVLDNQGKIIAVNRAWRIFAEANGLREGNVCEGADYFGVCDQAGGSFMEGAREFAHGIRSVLDGSAENFNMEYPCHSPEEQRWFIGKVTPVFFEGKRFAVVAHETITDRKLMEEELKISLTKYEVLFHSFPLGITISDKDGQIIETNKEAEKLLGLSREEQEKRKIDGREWRIIRSDGTPMPADEYASVRALKSGRLIENVEMGIAKGEGEVTWINVTAAPIPLEGYGVAITYGDISEREMAEKALRKSEELFRLIAETIAEVFWIWDITMDRAIYVSPGYERVWERTPESLYDNPRSFLDSIHDHDRERALEEFNMKKNGQPFECEFRIIRPNGDIRWIWDRGFPVKDDTGMVVRYVGVARDITLRKQAEEENEALEDQLRQAQKVEAVGRLAGGVAHEFNNLMQAILGQTALLKSELPPDVSHDPELGAVIDEIVKAAKRGGELTDQLLTFSRRQITRQESIDLNDVVLGVLKMIRPILGKNIDVSFKPGVALGTVMADRPQIEIMLMNLCMNARDAMSEGGKLSIETENVAVEEEFLRKHSSSTEENYVLLVVTDTGHGMDEDTSARIFEPFFTTKAVGQGTGLGLATVYGIVKQHQGMIDVVSTPGKGTSFKVFFPLDS